MDLLLTLTALEPFGDVRVALTRGGQEVALAEGTASREALGVARRQLGPLKDFLNTTVPLMALVGLGRALSELALPPPVRAGLQAALAATPDPAVPLRLRLAVSGAALEGLPWEFIHWGDSGTEMTDFLGLHPRLRLVRESPDRIGAGKKDSFKDFFEALQPVTGPVKMLIAHADPRAPGYPALPHLAREAAAVRSVLLPRRVEVEELPGATPAMLQRRLREWEPHIMHLMGHGAVRPSGEGIALQGEHEGSAAFVYAEELLGWLPAAVRLVVLSACRTSAESGMARFLSAAGVPAVVAMQLPLRDSAAAAFSRALYAALFEPCTTEEAVWRARTQVQGMGPDWGVPILYRNGPMVPLFAPQTEEPPPLPPTNLPYRRTATFVGRETLIAEIHRALDTPRSRTVALVGMGGLGKTHTAIEYAHTYAADYPGGTFWVDARDARTLEGEFAALGRRFFGAPAALPTGEGALWTRDALARSPRPTLLVFDNLAAEADLRLLPPSGHCRALLTTRSASLARAGICALAIPVLDDASSLALIQSYQLAEGPGEQLAAAGITATLGHLPLALALAAHHIHRLGVTFQTYAARLAEAPLTTLASARKRFVAATGHDGAFFGGGGLFDAFALSYRSLTSDTVGVLSAASAFAAHDIPADLLADAAGAGDTDRFEDMDRFEDAVADLVDSSWMTREEKGRLGIHELVRLFLQENTPPDERRQVVARTAALLTRRLESANNSGDWQDVRREVPHCFSVAHQCRRLCVGASRAPLLYELGRYSFEHSDLPAARELLEEGLAAAEPEGLPAARMLRMLAEVLDWQNVRWADAGRAGRVQGGLPGARRALRLARHALPPSDPELAIFYNTVGVSLRRLGQLPRALRFYQRALCLGDTGQRGEREAETLINIGGIYEAQEEPEMALQYLDEAVALLAGKKGAERLEAAARDNTGRILGTLGRYEEALAHHHQALANHEASFGRRHSHVAASLYYSAEAERGLGLSEEARRDYLEALLLYQKFYGDDNKRCEIVRLKLALLPRRPES